MIRTQIQLTKEQARELRKLARAQGVSMSEAVRRCVDRGLHQQITSRAELYARAARWIGGSRDREGRTDVAEQHDRYLDQAYD